MSEWQSFFAMGGYAAYVWPAFGISVAALLVLGVVSWREMRRAERLAKLADTPDKPA